MQWNDFHIAGGEMIAACYERPRLTSDTRYFHKDHLGSIAAIVAAVTASAPTRYCSRGAHHLSDAFIRLAPTIAPR